MGPCVVSVLLLDADLPVPARAHPGDAGADLVASADVTVPAGGGRVVVGTGIAIALPPGTAGLVLPRSGLAASHGVTVLNAPGLIDEGYRGEVKVILVNTDPIVDHVVRRGDRIAQLVVQPVAPVTFVVVEDLDETERGHGGHGSTGR